MQRPLLAVCMCFVTVTAAFLVADSTFLWRGSTVCREENCTYQEESAGLSEDELERNGIAGINPEVWDARTVIVTGNVYRKDSKYFYLDSVFIQNHAANLQRTIPLEENLLCEYGAAAPKIGSTVTVTGSFSAFGRATNPGEFDTAEYYHTLGIAGRITEISDLKSSEDYSLWQETLFELRCYFKQRLYHIFPEKEASIMAAMLLGDKQDIDGEIKELYQENGIIHILSISGLHITIIGMSIYKLLRRIGVPVWLAAFVGGGILVLYGVMTGMSISACRAIGMYLIKMLAEVTGRTYDMLIAMGIMAAGMVAVNPLYLKNAGFLLSFGAIVGIGMVYPSLAQEDDEEVGIQRYEARVWRRILKEFCNTFGLRLKQSMLSGLSVTLTTLPIQLWFYYEVPAYSVILNLFVLPFMTLVMLAGLVAMLVPGLGIVGTVDCVVLAGYEWLCRTFERLPFSTWNPGRPEAWQIIVYYGILALAVAEGETHFMRKIWRKIWENNRESHGVSHGVSHKVHRRGRLWGYARILLLTISVGIFSLNANPRTMVTFLDVGQGDCICIQLASGEVYLFDCGSTSRSKVGEYVLKPYLKYCGISYIDGVFVSHPDQDHCSGVEELLENGEDWGITVGKLVVSGAEGELWAEQLTGAGGELLGVDKNNVGAEYALEECVPDIMVIQAGDEWRVGDNCFRCLHPAADFISEDTNAGSQCFFVELSQGLKLLLTGDVEAEGEERLLAELQNNNINSVDILKVAHHGSKNSTSGEVLAQIQPQVSIISCGRNNSYGHPHEETMERLSDSGSVIMTTPDYGAITVELVERAAEMHCFSKPD